MTYCIIGRSDVDSPWDYVDSDVEKEDLNYTLNEYGIAFGPGWEFKVIEETEEN